MTNNSMKRNMLVIVPALLCGLLAALPFKPPTKIWFAVAETAGMALLLLCLSVYDLVRRVPGRPSIPLVWLTMAIGFGGFSEGLRTIAQTWGLRSAQLPFAHVGLGFGVGILCLLAGVVGFYLANQKREQMAL